MEGGEVGEWEGRKTEGNMGEQEVRKEGKKEGTGRG